MTAPAPVTFESGGVAETAVWFGPQDRPLFGWVTAPRTGRARAGVVLCSPFGEEASMAHRTFRTLAQRLAAEGALVVRYDHDGSGDSAGRLDDPGRVDAWVGGLRAAVELARELVGGGDVHVVGLRMGATLAAHAQSVRSLRLRSLTLWDPCATGRAFLRELQMLQASWLEGRPPVPEGHVETPNYRYSPETAAAIGALRLDPAGLEDTDVVLLERSDRSRPRLVESIVRDLALRPIGISEQEGLLNVPTIATAVPERTVDVVVRELVGRMPAQDTAVAGPSRPGAATFTYTGSDGSRAAISESARSFDDGALFGVVTEPAPEALRPDAPWFVFVNVALEVHIGPGRLWTDLARELALRGMRSVRLDQSSAGDSPDRPGQSTDELYSLAWLTDTAAVVDELGAPGAVLIGMCSSANSALEAALRTRVRGVFAINPFVAGSIDDEAGFRPQPPPVRRALRSVPPVISRLMVPHRRVARALWLAWTTLDLRKSVGAIPWTLVRRGSRVVVVAGSEDSEPFTREPFWRYLGGVLPGWRRRYRFDGMPHVDHSLRVHESRRDVARAFLAEAEQW